MTPRRLTFSFEDSLDVRGRARVLAGLRKLAGVVDAGQIAPSSKVARLRLLGWLELDPTVDLEALLRHLRTVPGTTAWSIPPLRRLVR